MSDEKPLKIALALDDPQLAGRVAAALAQAPGLRLALQGEAADVKIVASASSERADAALTPRELEVLLLLTEGASNKVIARSLGVSVHTAKFHVGRLLDKLDANGRADAVTHAARLGVINL